MLLDQGADINSIYRTPRNVVMTPLDCALNKGFRSTAKFLQIHSGLPASKLRLSGRNPNAINEQELVKPLHSMGKSKSDTKPKTTSDSTYQLQTTEQKCQCSVTDRCRRRYPRIKCCIHFRASSCETHTKGNESSDMNRSKSSIELRRTRKNDRTSRSKRRESTNTYSSSSSSESECLHCKASRRNRSKKSHRSRAKSTPRKNHHRPQTNHDQSSDEEWNRKSVTTTKYQRSTTKTTTKAVQNKQTEDLRNQTIEPNVGDKPEVAEVDSKEIGSNEPNINEIEVPVVKASLQDQTNAIETNEVEVFEDNLSTAVDGEKHDALEESHTKNELPSPSPGETANLNLGTNIIVATAEVHDRSRFENQNEVQKPDTNDALDAKQDEDNGKPSLDSNIIPVIEVIEQSESIQDETSPVKNDAEPSNKSSIGNVVVDLLQTTEESNSILTTSNELEAAIQDSSANECNITAPATPSDVQLNLPPNNNDTNSDSQIPDHCEKSIQVLEPNASSSEQRQPSPVVDESINRKSSFTVLASDESVDLNQLALDSDSIDDGPSFEVLESHEHIDDAKTSDDEDDGKQMTVSADEDEMSALNGGGRRKRVKNRAQSTILRRSLDQTSRDQDSGFEPSPRAVRTKIPTPQLLSSVVRSRRAVIGGRTNNVDMTAVTESLSMNIQR